MGATNSSRRDLAAPFQIASPISSEFLIKLLLFFQKKITQTETRVKLQFLLINIDELCLKYVFRDRLTQVYNKYIIKIIRKTFSTQVPRHCLNAMCCRSTKVEGPYSKDIDAPQNKCPGIFVIDQRRRGNTYRYLPLFRGRYDCGERDYTRGKKSYGDRTAGRRPARCGGHNNICIIPLLAALAELFSNA